LPVQSFENLWSIKSTFALLFDGVLIVFLSSQAFYLDQSKESHTINTILDDQKQPHLQQLMKDSIFYEVVQLLKGYSNHSTTFTATVGIYERKNKMIKFCSISSAAPKTGQKF
uniref:Uncharacterized protein n=1 Tax=Romanomermis culicivorax TaxID=13658 RepID=A0A915HRA8_ROMCU